MSGNTGDTHNIHGTTDPAEPGAHDEGDTASGGSPEQPDTTDDQGRPVDNPSGG